MEIWNICSSIYLIEKCKWYYLVDIPCSTSVYNWGEVATLFFLGITLMLPTAVVPFLYSSSLFYTQLLNRSTLTRLVSIHSIVHKYWVCCKSHPVSGWLLHYLRRSRICVTSSSRSLSPKSSLFIFSHE